MFTGMYVCVHSRCYTSLTFPATVRPFSFGLATCCVKLFFRNINEMIYYRRYLEPKTFFACYAS